MNDDDSILDLDSLWEEDANTLTDSTYSNTISSALGNATTLSTSLSGGYALGSLGTVTASGTVGATLSTSNTGSLLWNNPTYTATASPYANATHNWTTYTQPQVLKVNGDAEFDGDVKIKGVSIGHLNDRLDAIEERLGILRPNNDLEGKWEKLKALGDEYRRLEKEILEKENMWDILKK